MPYVTNDGIRVYYEDEGAGPAIVFHTGAGGDLRIWRLAGYVEGLPGFRKILIDHRGRGKSDRPSGIESHRIQANVSDIGAVLDAAGVDSCAFWGYSRGIYVGLAFGLAHPARLRALVGTGSLWDQNLTDLPAVDPDQIIREDVAQGGVRHELDSLRETEQDSFPGPIDRNVRDGDPLMHALARVAWRSWRGPLALYPQFAHPTLILSGEKEDAEHSTEKCIQLMPHAKLVRIPGVGHLGAFYRSDLSLPSAVPFLRETLA